MPNASFQFAATVWHERGSAAWRRATVAVTASPTTICAICASVMSGASGRTKPRSPADAAR